MTTTSQPLSRTLRAAIKSMRPTFLCCIANAEVALYQADMLGADSALLDDVAAKIAALRSAAWALIDSVAAQHDVTL